MTFLKGYRVTIKTELNIRNLAENLRKYYGIGFEAICPLKLIELGLSQSRFWYDIVDNHELNGKAAEARPQINLIAITDKIYKEAGLGMQHAREVVAHEIGHIALEHHVPLAFGGESPHVNKMEDSEVQANIFSEELILSATGCSKCKSPKEIEALFAVNSATALKRWQKLKTEGVIK